MSRADLEAQLRSATILTRSTPAAAPASTPRASVARVLERVLADDPFERSATEFRIRVGKGNSLRNVVVLAHPGSGTYSGVFQLLPGKGALTASKLGDWRSDVIVSSTFYTAREQQVTCK